MTYVIIVDPSMKYKVKKISSQLSYSIMKEISKKKKLKIKRDSNPCLRDCVGWTLLPTNLRSTNGTFTKVMTYLI